MSPPQNDYNRAIFFKGWNASENQTGDNIHFERMHKEVSRARKYTSQSRVKVTFEVAKEDMSQIALNTAFEGEREFWKVPERR